VIEPSDDEKVQFNVYLPRALVRSVKHASVDSGQSLSRFAEEALRHHLDLVKKAKEQE
jgi:predicted HicB family RNase H-like nuclease